MNDDIVASSLPVQNGIYHITADWRESSMLSSLVCAKAHISAFKFT